jgi:hypothetical protein
MARGKRTGAVNATVFFDDPPPNGQETDKYEAPRFSLLRLRELEKVKQGAKRLGSEYDEQLRQTREQKRKAEYQAFKDDQIAQLTVIDAHLEAVRAKLAAIPSSSNSELQMPILPANGPEKTDTVVDSSYHTDNHSTNTIVDSMEGLGELDQAVISHRLKASQLKLRAIATKEKLDKLEAVFEGLPHLTEEEAKTALLLLGDDEFDVIEEYERYPELRELRLTIARKHTEEAQKPRPKAKRGSSSTKAKAKVTATGDASAPVSSKSSKVGAKKGVSTSAIASLASSSANLGNSASSVTTPRELAPTVPSLSHSASSGAAAMNTADQALAALLPEGTDLNYVPPRDMDPTSHSASLHEDDDSAQGGEDVYELDGEDYATRTHKKKKQITVKKLRLDDAIAQGSTEGWSAARVRAWNLRHENPNAYYYRFNQPGEEQRNGKWTELERERFFARMNEVGVNGQWGIFAKEIYGRVGYQCANFYRQMIENNEIEDPRYVIDESGKAHFLFSKRKKKNGSGIDTSTASASSRNNGGDAANDECEETELGSMEGMTKITRDGKDIYIPKINVPVRRAATTSRSKNDSVPRSAQSAELAGASTHPTPKPSKEGNGRQKSASMASASPSVSLAVPSAAELAYVRTIAPKLTPEQIVGVTASTGAVDAKASGGVSQRAKAAGEARERKKNAKKRKRPEEGDDEDYRPSSSWSREKAELEATARMKDRLESNPLPGFKDVITNSELIEPAISPYGHVLSYATWLKCLTTDPKHTCPFTKQPLKKRDLVILTWENIEEYQDKIDRSGQS